MSEQEINQLRRENAELRRENARLRNAIEDALFYTDDVRNKSNAVITQRSGVPRGVWGFARGALKVAQMVRAYLGAEL